MNRILQGLGGLIVVLLSCTVLSAQDIRPYPTHWWSGMKNPKLQVLLRGDNIGKSQARINYPGVTLEKIHRFANNNYLALDLRLAATVRPGTFSIQLSDNAGGNRTVPYRIKARERDNGTRRIRGVDATDFIYLIMPDRFANGDPSNDRLAGYKDPTFSRDSIFYRHGGDLQGITQRLDYLQDLGVTALWLNPVLDNDMSLTSYHGYAFTDHYKIDERLGGEKAYKALIDSLHGRGMKIIQDAVYNHVGIEHFLFRDLPDSSWFHFFPSHVNTTYKDQVLMDPYAAPSDYQRMADGWFTPFMPDFNHKNSFVENFLIQHAIWSTEEFGLDGWRIDTYAYNDLEFMNRCNAAILKEYPQIGMFGETWVHGIPNQSFFTANKLRGISYESNLPGVTDFQLNLYGIIPALTQGFGWTDGVNRLYLTSTNDFVYEYPYKNVIFLDNHDVSRFYSIVGESIPKLKMGIAWLLTFRGIPQLYYGTEILMKNYAAPDGLVRLDFPGGWPGDPVNKFAASGRTADEQDVYLFTKTLAQYRKRTPALHFGKMMQYVPDDGVFVYFRYDNSKTVMCVMNTNNLEKTIDIRRFQERTNGFRSARSITDMTNRTLQGTWKVPALTLGVYELEK